MARAHYVYRGGEVVYAVENGEVTVDKRGDVAQEAGYFVMGDIAPYKSMIDGSVISSRSTHRAHLRAHGCIEIGNEKQTPAPKALAPGLKADVVRSYQQAVENAKRRK